MGSYLLMHPATEMGADYAVEEKGTQHPVPGSSVGEAPLGTIGAAPPHDEVPAPPSTAPEATAPEATVSEDDEPEYAGAEEEEQPAVAGSAVGEADGARPEDLGEEE